MGKRMLDPLVVLPHTLDLPPADQYGVILDAGSSVSTIILRRVYKKWLKLLGNSGAHLLMAKRGVG